MNDIFAELTWRGLIHQTTDDENLPKWLNEQSRVVYAGFDPTADSLHVGSLMPLLLLRRFQRAGHKPIALVGGSTGMIGDPSGKSAERNLLDKETLEKNIAGLETQMRDFLDFQGPNAAVLVNNFDWMKDFSYLNFLRDIGKNFPVNVMMGKDSVKSRLEGESGLSYTEFSYMLLQAYDFVYLNQNHDCFLQVGGSDQWGNITAGIDLGRRMHGVQLFGLTNPLLTKSDGGKMGKTESGAIWLDATRTSPYDFYQYWFNVSDNDASKCLRFLTELTEPEITELDKSREAESHKRASQIALAENLTRLVHGEDGLATAERAKKIFFGGEVGDITDDQLTEILGDVLSEEVPRAKLDEGLPILEAFVAAGLSKSKGEARRTVQQGGAYVNNVRCQEVDHVLKSDDLTSETVMLLRSGKKKFALLKFT
ncbi:MAG: tyrosine--tRNA ligase [Planctomycetota bacterium]